MSSPQRPAPPVLDAMRRFIAGRTMPVLQLGVTPEIARIAPQSLALDNSPEMLRLAWPGDSPTHRAILGDWLAMPLSSGSIDLALGDGCLTVLQWPREAEQFFRELRRVLRKGGRLVLRCFAGPDEPETLSALKAAALEGRIEGFRVFKLRFNMAAFALAAGADNTGIWIHRLFETHFPDRARLATALGEDVAVVDSIDRYVGSPSIHSYPTRDAIAAMLPAGVRHRFVPVGGYPLAERCPLLVADFP